MSDRRIRRPAADDRAPWLISRAQAGPAWQG